MRSVTRACRHLANRAGSPVATIVTAHALILFSGLYLLLIHPSGRLEGLWMAGVLAIAGAVWAVRRVGAAGLSIASLGAVCLLCGHAFVGSLLEMDARPPAEVATMYQWVGGLTFVFGLGFFAYENLRRANVTPRPDRDRKRPS